MSVKALDEESVVVPTVGTIYPGSRNVNTHFLVSPQKKKKKKN